MPCSGSSFVIELKSSLPFAEFVTKKMTITKVWFAVVSRERMYFHFINFKDNIFYYYLSKQKVYVGVVIRQNMAKCLQFRI